MNFKKKQNYIVDELLVFDEILDKYQVIIEFGDKLPIIDSENKNEKYLVQGCTANVWLDSSFENGKMQFKADSDADIPKGIVSILTWIFNNETPQTVIEGDLTFLAESGLNHMLTPSRSNGMHSMIKKMKLEALKALKD